MPSMFKIEFIIECISSIATFCMDKFSLSKKIILICSFVVHWSSLVVSKHTDKLSIRKTVYMCEASKSTNSYLGKGSMFRYFQGKKLSIHQVHSTVLFTVVKLWWPNFQYWWRNSLSCYAILLIVKMFLFVCDR